MRGVSFQDRAVGVARSAYRADVALFVGFVDRRRTGANPTPIVPRRLAGGGRAGEPSLYRWLVTQGWARGDEAKDVAAGLDELLDVPVPIDRFDTFDRLFAWDRRPIGASAGITDGDTYLGAAVREFFANGGRLCYVVRVGAPWPAPVTVEESRAVVAQRAARLEALIPGTGGGPTGTPMERATWRGAWTVFGLPEVSFVALPDLPDVVRADFEEERPLPVPAVGEPVFAECAEPIGAVDPSRLRRLRAPACLDDGFADWARALGVVAGEVARARSAGGLREMQVVAAVPRPDERTGVHALVRYLEELGLARHLDAGGLATGFLQLVYPWLAIEGSDRVPGGIVPPDAILCGLLAGNALARGCFRSAAGAPVRGAIDQDPRLAGADVRDPSDRATLAGRVSIVGPTAAGVQLVSDVTTSLDPTWRIAQAQRAVATIVRVLRTIGEDHAFAVSNAATWSQVRSRVRELLRDFWLAGALRGDREADAFSVRCDRTTMTQDDLDAGRLIVHVELAISVAIQRIEVVLTRTGDQVTAERAA
jgi:hypothetical protein